MGRLKSIGPTVKPASTAVANAPEKTVDRYYLSAEWQDLRRACLDRDRYRCQVRLPGCLTRASIADHITSRKDGGADALWNLRSLCRNCDNKLKEDHLGRRRGSQFQAT